MNPRNPSFVAVLEPQLQFTQKLALRRLKLPSHLLNPENSLNETGFGTARHVHRAEHEDIKMATPDGLLVWAPVTRRR